MVSRAIRWQEGNLPIAASRRRLEIVVVTPFMVPRGEHSEFASRAEEKEETGARTAL